MKTIPNNLACFKISQENPEPALHKMRYIGNTHKFPKDGKIGGYGQPNLSSHPYGLRTILGQPQKMAEAL